MFRGICIPRATGKGNVFAGRSASVTCRARHTSQKGQPRYGLIPSASFFSADRAESKGRATYTCDAPADVVGTDFALRARARARARAR